MLKSKALIVFILFLMSASSHAKERQEEKFRLNYAKFPQEVGSLSEKCNFSDYLNNFYSANLVLMIMIDNENSFKERCDSEKINSFYDGINSKAVVYTVEGIYDEYSSNEYVAQKNINKKWIVISGKIEEIALSITGSPTIKLLNKDDRLSSAQLDISIEESEGIKNWYTTQQDAILEKLKKGNLIRIYCEKYSFVMGNVIGDTCVIL
ncbi:OB-fold putative lipoprotein [Dickeya zeae]|nr:OB-fold putative lipoprotein [Dickeya zeae]